MYAGRTTLPLGGTVGTPVGRFTAADQLWEERGLNLFGQWRQTTTQRSMSSSQALISWLIYRKSKFNKCCRKTLCSYTAVNRHQLPSKQFALLRSTEVYRRNGNRPQQSHFLSQLIRQLPTRLIWNFNCSDFNSADTWSPPVEKFWIDITLYFALIANSS
jgi:hypothetical protein